MKMLEWIFKMGLLAIGAGFVAACFLFSENGRYQYFKEEGRTTVLDTRTGIVRQTVGSHSIVGYLDLVNNVLRLNEIKIYDLSPKEEPMQ